MVGVKDKTMSLFETSTNENYSKPTCVNNVHDKITKNNMLNTNHFVKFNPDLTKTTKRKV